MKLGAGGGVLSFFNSWSGALAYTLQLYFDFSGYSDIAIGLGLMFGIRLPLNFYSPYKATSIIDFWRRWHMTLSSFIRDYIYIPLGGNLHGFIRQMAYLLIAMAIAGFWHGAGWTFIIWGGLHGAYLVINHSWRRLMIALRHDSEKSTWWGTGISTLITFIAVTIAWVFFRADSVSTAVNMLRAMVGMYGFHLPVYYSGVLGAIAQFLGRIGVSFDLPGWLPGFTHTTVMWILASLFICWFLPNVQEYMSDYQPSLDSFPGEAKKRLLPRLRWKPSLGLAAIIACLSVAVILGLNHVSKFIYFQF